MAYIDSLGSSGMKFDLGRIREVLSSLGNPHHKFPSVHLAGTNGKGSVAVMLASALRKKYRVGLYTSPHLVRLNERFQINGKLISNKDLANLSSRVQENLNNTHLTQFEFLTVLAFLWFADQKIDLAIVETGLGGRLDATNCLERVLLSVITMIDKDHTSWLGSSIKKIAKEKAGIIKSRVPVVTGTTGKALEVIANQCLKFKAPIHVVSKSHLLPDEAEPLFLKGRHQLFNASLAYQSLKILSKIFPLSDKHQMNGIRQAKWPGRFEQIRLGTRQNKRHIILDGAHNPSAIDALVETLRQQQLNKVNVLFGALKDKDVKGMVRALLPVARQVTLVPLPSERSIHPEKLVRLWAKKVKPSVKLDLSAGWEKAVKQSAKRPLLVTGSLYLVGAIRDKIIYKKHR